MSKVYTKNRNIWDTNSKNMWILADEACRITNFHLLRHNDVITIPYRKYDFRFDIRVSKFISIVIFNS